MGVHARREHFIIAGCLLDNKTEYFLGEALSGFRLTAECQGDFVNKCLFICGFVKGGVSPAGWVVSRKTVVDIIIYELHWYS